MFFLAVFVSKNCLRHIKMAVKLRACLPFFNQLTSLRAGSYKIDYILVFSNSFHHFHFWDKICKFVISGVLWNKSNRLTLLTSKIKHNFSSMIGMNFFNVNSERSMVHQRNIPYSMIFFQSSLVCKAHWCLVSQLVSRSVGHFIRQPVRQTVGQSVLQSIAPSSHSSVRQSLRLFVRL